METVWPIKRQNADIPPNCKPASQRRLQLDVQHYRDTLRNWNNPKDDDWKSSHDIHLQL